MVRERDRQKNEICKAHHMQIIRVENSYARRYHYIKEILNDYLRRHVKNFAFKHPAKSGMMSLCITQDKGENNTIWKKEPGIISTACGRRTDGLYFAYTGENR